MSLTTLSGARKLPKTSLCCIKSHTSTVEYAVEFWTLAANAGRNDEALQEVFLKGLNNHIKDDAVARDGPEGLNSLISLATSLDNHL